MNSKKRIWVIGVLCLAINLVSIYFFINRNTLGNFTRLVTYDELYSTAGNSTNDLKKWQNIQHQYPGEQLQEAKKLTALYAGIKDTDSSLTKIIKIGSWLRRSFSKCEIGKPTDSFEKLSKIDQFKAATRAESPIWCGTFGSQFLFFCCANNITSRYIETTGLADNHIVNEFFVSELNQWVFSDLLNNVLYCKDGNGNLLNTVDLLYMNSQKDTNAITAFQQIGNDSILVVPGREHSKLWHTHLNSSNKLHFYYSTDLNQMYNPVQKIIRYIYPKTWFEIFTLTNVSNAAFYVRMLFLYSGIFLLIIFILLLKNK